MKFFNYKSIVILFFSLTIFKLIIFLLIVNYTSLGGGDATYYHKYAVGLLSTATSIWPKFLFYLNDHNLYNRDGIKYVLFIVSSIVIPLLIAIIINKSFLDYKYKNRFFWHISCLVALYPSLFFFSIDIYRDIVMLFIFLIIIYLISMYIVNKSLSSVVLFVAIMIISIHLIDWRPYLGVSIIITMLLYKLSSLKLFSMNRIILIYVIALLILYSTGVLDPLLSYRESEGFRYGRTTLYIVLHGKNLVEFLLLFIYSGLIQLGGLYFHTIGAIFLFFMESLPFLIGIFYIIKNRLHIGDFEIILLLFSLVYGTIWILANDNLGTAIRLRMFIYIAIFIVVGKIYIKKKIRI